MRRLALIAALISGAASAQGMGGPGLGSGAFTSSRLAPGATGADLTCSSVDAGVVATPDLELTGGANGSATIKPNGTSGIVLTTGGGKVFSLSNSTGNTTISGTYNTSGAGAGGCLFCSGTGTGQFTGDTHANRSTSAGVFGYCTTDSAIYVGNGTAAKDLFSTTCTLNAASPAACTATVPAASTCVAIPVGTTAAAGAVDPAVSLSGTTLTVTAANGANQTVNIHCF